MKWIYVLVVVAAVGGVGWYFLWGGGTNEVLETQGTLASEPVPAPVVNNQAATPTVPPEPAKGEATPLPVQSPKEGDDEVDIKGDTSKPKPVPATTPAATTESTGDIVVRLMKSGFGSGSNNRDIDTVIIHSSYNAGSGDPYDREKTIQQYVDYGVSAHYIIDRSGVIYQLVRERDIAYHAGVGKLPNGDTNINERSIGIEIIGTKDSGYTKSQYAAVQSLVDSVKKRYTIQYLLGHEDVAPDRKTDPWAFDWSKLPKKGLKK